MVRNIWTGTNVETGKRTEFHGTVLWRVANGKLVERSELTTPRNLRRLKTSPSPTPSAVDFHERPNTTAVGITVTGEAVASILDELTQYVFRRAAQCRRLILDLQNVEFFSTGGVSKCAPVTRAAATPRSSGR
jgi:hypothetical protein